MSKNLLFIGKFPPPYQGSNIDNKNLVSHWNSSKLKMSILDISNHNRQWNEFGKITKGNLLCTLKGLKSLMFLLPSWNYDFTLFHLSQGILGILKESLYIFIIKIFTKSKMVCRFPGGDFLKFFNNSGAFKSYIKLVLNNINLIITEGEIASSQFHKINKTIKLISAHIGIPDHGIKNFKSPIKRFEVLYICNHCKEKGLWDVIYSMPAIVGEKTNIIFNFAGELRLTENEKKKLYEFIDKELLSDFIKFHGVITGEEKWELFRRASIQILPSYSEGLPTSIIEGLSFGLPIVASNVGAIPEVVKDGVNGFIINPGDRTKLCEIILRLSRDSSLVNQISQTNRKYFLEEFTIDKFCKRIEQCIATL